MTRQTKRHRWPQSMQSGRVKLTRRIPRDQLALDRSPRSFVSQAQLRSEFLSRQGRS